MSGNAWPSERTNRDGTTYGPTQEQHIPIRSFNAKETREELLRGYNSAMAGDLKPATYKALGKEVNNPKPGGPWGSKPNTMANGKDFFLELRKQVSMLQSNPSIDSA
ncbi:MAG: hypothetical protein M1830_000371 [Pleopsidium flavum]|nr:MAG: hypothetical protein M1830_000371 [Pleopsidium flavum]